MSERLSELHPARWYFSPVFVIWTSICVGSPAVFAPETELLPSAPLSGNAVFSDGTVLSDGMVLSGAAVFSGAAVLSDAVVLSGGTVLSDEPALFASPPVQSFSGEASFWVAMSRVLPLLVMTIVP